MNNGPLHFLNAAFDDSNFSSSRTEIGDAMTELESCKTEVLEILNNVYCLKSDVPFFLEDFTLKEKKLHELIARIKNL